MFISRKHLNKLALVRFAPIIFTFTAHFAATDHCELSISPMMFMGLTGAKPARLATISEISDSECSLATLLSVR